MKHNRKRYEEITLIVLQGLLANPVFATTSADDIAIQASEIAYAVMDLFERESNRERKDNE